MTIGIRNRNPLNVKQVSGGDWKGSSGADASGHAIFYHELYSVRACLRTLANIQLKRGADTILKIIEIYAPESDGNNPKDYADFIAQRLGHHRSDTVIKLFFENGQIASSDIGLMLKAKAEYENFAGYVLAQDALMSGMASYHNDFVRG